MAKPRVFISSTYYDLKYIRRSVEQFIESLGYEATVFESGDVVFTHDTPLDESCYREIGLCHVLVLIIGGRYGSGTSEEREKAIAAESKASVGSENKSLAAQHAEKEKRYALYNSVTTKEYQTARELDIPIYIFVEKGVLAEYETYKKNRTANLTWAHVDSINIFRLLDDIFAQSRNNLVREFGTADDITSWLRDQWAGLLAHFISKRRDDVSVGQLKAQMDSLSSVVSALKTYSEQIVRNVAKSDSEKIISNVDKELHAKQAESMVLNLRGMDHLITNHNAKPHQVFKAFSEANSLDDLFSKLDKMGDCGYAQHSLFPLQDEINRVRQNLGLKLFPPHKRDDSNDFRKARMRRMGDLRDKEQRRKNIAADGKK